MKYFSLTLLVFLFCSCSDSGNDAVPAQTNIRVDHFQQPATGEGTVLSLKVQENDAIGSDDWQLFYNQIEGFNYELSYVYDLNVRTEPIDNPPADGFSVRYILNEVVNRQRVPENTRFQILLKREGNGYGTEYVTQSSNGNFQLAGQTAIDCSPALCSQLQNQLNDVGPVRGIFQHQSANAIRLVELR